MHVCQRTFIEVASIVFREFAMPTVFAPLSPRHTCARTTREAGSPSPLLAYKSIVQHKSGALKTIPTSSNNRINLKTKWCLEGSREPLLFQ
eukprot:4830586-Amphidinium_carterae.1